MQLMLRHPYDSPAAVPFQAAGLSVLKTDQIQSIHEKPYILKYMTCQPSHSFLQVCHMKRGCGNMLSLNKRFNGRGYNIEE